MTVRIKRLGSEREPDEGLRIGTVRRPPRGIKKEEYSSRNLYDVWFPNLAPSEALLKEFFPIEGPGEWKAFRRRFLAEMKLSGPKRDLDLLAALSQHANFSVGCYCEEEKYCHRSILRELLAMRGASMAEAEVG